MDRLISHLPTLSVLRWDQEWLHYGCIDMTTDNYADTAADFVCHLYVRAFSTHTRASPTLVTQLPY